MWSQVTVQFVFDQVSLEAAVSCGPCSRLPSAGEERGTGNGALQVSCNMLRQSVYSPLSLLPPALRIDKHQQRMSALYCCDLNGKMSKQSIAVWKLQDASQEFTFKPFLREFMKCTQHIQSCASHLMFQGNVRPLASFHTELSSCVQYVVQFQRGYILYTHTHICVCVACVCMYTHTRIYHHLLCFLTIFKL